MQTESGSELLRPQHDTNIVNACVEGNDWERLRQYFESNPKATRGSFVPHGSLLHLLCSIGSVPVTVIDLIARLDPSAILSVDRRFGDTCLHIVARNSQTSAAKLKCLLGHLEDNDRQDLLIRNIVGGTALHSAANHNAVLEALQLLVASNPQIIHTRTLDGTHALSALWNSFIQTIPGYMLVARVLEESEDIDDPFYDRFWSKAEFLALQQVRSLGLAGAGDVAGYVVHGLLKANVAIHFFKIALRRNPVFARAADADGNFPLHRLLEDRPYRLKEREAIKSILEAAPDSARVLNNVLDCPLLIAIRNRIPWDNGLDLVAQEGRHLMARRDVATQLLPFQYAACISGRYAVETTFRLLLQRPDLLTCC